jgi:hypothetical protein
VLGVAVAVFELELLLAALLGGGAGDQAVLARVAQDGVAELLVDQDTRRRRGTPLVSASFSPS